MEGLRKGNPRTRGFLRDDPCSHTELPVMRVQDAFLSCLGGAVTGGTIRVHKPRNTLGFLEVHSQEASQSPLKDLALKGSEAGGGSPVARALGLAAREWAQVVEHGLCTLESPRLIPGIT